MNSSINHSQHYKSLSIKQGIRGRLFMGFGLITFILVIAITLVLYKITIVENLSNQVIKVDLPKQNTFYDLTMKVYEAELALNEWLATHNDNTKSLIYKAWKLIDEEVNNMDTYLTHWNNPEYSKKWQHVQALLVELKKEHMNAVNSAPNSNTFNLRNNIDLFNQLISMIDGPLDETGNRRGGLFDNQYDKLQAGANQIIAEMHYIRYIEYFLLALCALVSFIVAIYTSRGIINYVNTFRQHSAKIASGDLRHRVEVASHDEMGQLGNDLNQMTESLVGITKQITETCHNMVATIEEVKQAVDIQSSGATEQASSINQITASLEEIEKSSTQTIDKAKTLGEVAERTREKGRLGLTAVQESVNGMKSVREKVQTIAETILDLSNQTQQVGEITSVVNSLAQQSKMLALNASIEAAKAGEAGKGFAVVAAEVKNLAEQSEQSTSQVQKILEDIRRATEKAVIATEEGTKGVDQGTGLVEQTGDIVQSLSDVIHEATIASQQIEAAIRQEGVGIEQITAGMTEINQVTASFVASVKQTTEAIGNLALMVQNLKQYTDVYKY